MPNPALGLIETEGLEGAIEAARAATGGGQVVIASLERSAVGLVTVKIEGEWQAVQAAVEAGARAAEQAGELVSMHIIPRTDNGLSPILPYGRFVAKYHPDGKPTRQRPSPPPAARRPKVKTSERAAKATSVKPETAPPKTPEAEKSIIDRPKPRPAAAEPSGEKPQVGMSDLEKMPVARLRKYARSIRNLPIQGRQISVANKQTLLEVIRSALNTELQERG